MHTLTDIATDRASSQFVRVSTDMTSPFGAVCDAEEASGWTRMPGGPRARAKSALYQSERCSLEEVSPFKEIHKGPCSWEVALVLLHSFPAPPSLQSSNLQVATRELLRRTAFACKPSSDLQQTSRFLVKKSFPPLHHHGSQVSALSTDPIWHLHDRHHWAPTLAFSI